MSFGTGKAQVLKVEILALKIVSGWMGQALDQL